MVSALEWCYNKAPDNLAYESVYVVLDEMLDKCLHKFLLKHSRYKASELSNLSIEALSNLTPKNQYCTLLSYILVTGIYNVPQDKMIIFIDWMLQQPDTYETGLIAYIWCNSSLNDMSRYPCHSKMLSIVDNGCDFENLKFLWKVAKSDNIDLCNIISHLANDEKVPRYFRLLVLIYIKSKVDIEYIRYFFSDAHRLQTADIEDCYIELISYNWTKMVIHDLVKRKYTLYRLCKTLKKKNLIGITVEGKDIPIDYLSKKFFKPKLRYFTLNSLPTVPNGFKLCLELWSNSLNIVSVIKEPILSKYEAWFNNLTEDKLKSLENENPVVYEACCNKQFKYVEPLLDSIMLRSEYL